LLESLDKRNLDDGESMFIFSLTFSGEEQVVDPNGPGRASLSSAGPGALYEL
jgi:hypothetical protein